MPGTRDVMRWIIVDRVARTMIDIVTHRLIQATSWWQLKTVHPAVRGIVDTVEGIGLKKKSFRLKETT